MERFEITDIKISGGYFQQKHVMNREVTIPVTYEQFRKTGRVDAPKLDWKEGEPDRPHIFWDSDMAKWIEGAAYALSVQRDANLELLIDGFVDDMATSQAANGYFNSYFQNVEYANRFTRRNDHELYCAGHLMEAAVAYKEATGKAKMLEIMTRYADLIYDVFTAEDRKFYSTPGHEEIELALVKLYHETGNKKYLELSRFFIDKRGTIDSEKLTNNGWSSENYAQDHLPINEQFTAEGHAVRCLYMFAGAADIAAEYGDEKLKNACEKVFGNIADKRMYVTGGIGGNFSGEAFSYDYDLPNELAYTETCASIAMIFFSERMYLLTGEKKYMDMIELQFYNAVMSGISIQGGNFFYCNPLEMHPERRDYFTQIRNSQFAPEYTRPEYFGCSCCPPNVIRLIASIGQYMYQKKGGDLYVNLYNTSEATHDGLTVSIKTNYPADGKINATLRAEKSELRTVYFRVPDWCKTYNYTILTDNKYEQSVENGYIKISADFSETAEISIEFDMPVTEMYANPKLHYAAGCVAVKRGPIVYCAEGVDNGVNLKSVSISKTPAFDEECVEICGEKYVMLTADANFSDDGNNESLYKSEPYKTKQGRLKLIPYAAWANRGRNEMLVWIGKE